MTAMQVAATATALIALVPNVALRRCPINSTARDTARGHRATMASPRMLPRPIAQQWADRTATTC
jgi:hypothetical protein